MKGFPALARQINKERLSLKRNPDPMKEAAYREFRLNQGAGDSATRRLLDIASIRRIERTGTTINAIIRVRA